jgi:hypothetical protein
MNNNFKALERLEIVSVESSEKILLKQPTYKVNEFLEELINLIKRYEGFTEAKMNWFTEGISCEVLKLDGKGWRKGKIRLALEFCPDEAEIEEPSSNNSDIQASESSLDDIRRIIKDGN